MTLTDKQSEKTGIGGSYYESYANFVNPADDLQKTFFTYVQSDLWRSSGGIGGGCSCPYGLTTRENLPLKIATVENPIRTQFRGQSPKWTLGAYFPDASRGGKGGNITVSENATVNAYNGSYITTRDLSKENMTERQNTQALIYAQAGYDVKAVRELFKVKVVEARTIEDLVEEWSNEEDDYDFSDQRTIASPYDATCGDTLRGKFILGIGSGAGGSQDSDGNGTYSIDSSLN